MRPDHVIIIGGGIAGLTLARALEQRSITATVYEQSPQLREVGAGIGLWSNALSVLEALGYGDALADLGEEIRRAEFVSPDGRCLTRHDVEELLADASIATPPRVVHRGALLEMLAEGLEVANIVTGKRCRSVEWRGERPTVIFEDGTSETADLVVGADGLWSKVRASLWGDEPARYSGEYCFRGIAYGVDNDRHTLRELQGRGRRVGLGALADKLTYWWATWTTDEGFELPRDEFHSFLAERFAGWPLNIPAIMGATDSDDIHLDALYDRPPRAQWSRGAVTLVGDAAHPTTPNLGQGGCMAIEDAAVLAELLVRSTSLDEALGRYEQLRIPRTSKLVRESLRFGKIGQWSNPVAVWMRATLVGLVPRRIMQAQLVDKVAYDALAAAREY